MKCEYIYNTIPKNHGFSANAQDTHLEEDPFWFQVKD